METTTIIGYTLCIILCLSIPISSGSSEPYCISRTGSPQTQNKNLPFCSLPVEELVSGRVLSGSSTRHSQLPPWVNLTLALQGQQFARKNLLASGLSAAYGLFQVLAMPDIRDVLIFTADSDTPSKAIKRYVATGTHIFLWADEPIRPDPVNNPFLISIARVREVHLRAAERANQAGHGKHLKFLRNPKTYKNFPTNEKMWSLFKKDLKESSIPEEYRGFSKSYQKYGTNPKPINQFAQAVTLHGFMGFLAMDPESVYLRNVTDDDLMAYAHFWAIIGYGLGIDDEYNICLQPDVPSLKAYLKGIQNLYYTPALFNLEKASKILIEALFAAYGDFMPGFGGRSLSMRFLRDMLNIPVPNMMTSLNALDKRVEVAYQTKFIPKALAGGFNEGLTKGAPTALQTAVAAIFGPYLTNLELAEHVTTNHDCRAVDFQEVNKKLKNKNELSSSSHHRFLYSVGVIRTKACQLQKNARRGAKKV